MSGPAVLPVTYEFAAKSRSIFARAKKRGEITPQPCRDCGTTTKVEGHHADYSKPLEVIWLCRKHHAAEHARLGIALVVGARIEPKGSYSIPENRKNQNVQILLTREEKQRLVKIAKDNDWTSLSFATRTLLLESLIRWEASAAGRKRRKA